jgi:sugar phosphate isomerase/epimerase
VINYRPGRSPTRIARRCKSGAVDVGTAFASGSGCDYLVHARTARRLPGQGELDVAGLVRAVLRTGFTGPWCVEVNTPDFRALPAEEAARCAVDAASVVLDAAGAPRTMG